MKFKIGDIVKYRSPLTSEYHYIKILEHDTIFKKRRELPLEEIGGYRGGSFSSKPPQVSVYVTQTLVIKQDSGKTIYPGKYNRNRVTATVLDHRAEIIDPKSAECMNILYGDSNE